MRADQEFEESDGTRTTTNSRSPRLRIDQRCRVDGVLHAYLGPTHLADEGELLHAFARCEWRPNTPGQLPVTVVRDSDLAASVVPIRRPLIR
jgi:hypothetical protein